MLISEKIFELLEERGMSEAAFAKKIGTSRSTVNSWKIRKQNPSSDKIMKICEVLEVSPEELLSDKDKQDTPKKKKKIYTEKEKELVDVYDDLSPKIQKRMLEYAKRLRRMEERGEI